LGKLLCNAANMALGGHACTCFAPQDLPAAKPGGQQARPCWQSSGCLKQSPLTWYRAHECTPFKGPHEEISLRPYHLSILSQHLVLRVTRHGVASIHVAAWSNHHLLGAYVQT